MPLQKSSGRSGGSSRRPTPPVQRPIPPPPPVLPQQQTGGGSMMAGMAGTIAQGVAFGTGSAVAHRAVDAVMGPRTNQPEHEQVSPNGTSSSSSLQDSSSSQDACVNQFKAFQDCLRANSNDISKCQYYVDMLHECRKASPPSSSSDSEN